MQPKRVYGTAEDLIRAIDEYLLWLRENTGRISIPVEINWDGDNGNILRLSGAGKCPRQTAYGKHYPEDAEELSARALNVFIHGDILHAKERELIRRVTYLHGEEERVEFPLGGGHPNVIGHIDGRIFLGEQQHILDIKSVNTRGFKEALSVGPRQDYIDQLNAYMEATGVHHAVLWMYNKDTSHRAAVTLGYDADRAQAIRERFISVLKSTPDSLPDRMFEPQWEISRGKRTGREYLPWNCGYCAFVDKCWADTGFEMVFEKGKPRWIRANEKEEGA